jgi:hypothetical protein
LKVIERRLRGGVKLLQEVVCPYQGGFGESTFETRNAAESEVVTRDQSLGSRSEDCLIFDIHSQGAKMTALI